MHLGNNTKIWKLMSSGNGKIVTSPDGVKWRNRIFPDNKYWLGGVIYGNNTFAAVLFLTICL
ncbi:hypothetical protein HY745_01325 [Candidatus Desantisbacteria bacterium]|nr:hypothetical protein [Candidatus Desantisbacteria bacterium]